MWYILKKKEQTTALPRAQMTSKEKNCKLYDSIHMFIWSSGISKTHLWCQKSDQWLLLMGRCLGQSMSIQLPGYIDLTKLRSVHLRSVQRNLSRGLWVFISLLKSTSHILMLFCLCLLSYHTVSWPSLILLFCSLCSFSCSFSSFLNQVLNSFFLTVTCDLQDLSPPGIKPGH